MLVLETLFAALRVCGHGTGGNGPLNITEEVTWSRMMLQ